MSGVFSFGAPPAAADPKKTDAVQPDDPKKTDGAQPDSSALSKRRTYSQEERINELLLDVSKRSPPAVAEYVKKATPFLVPAINGLITVFNVVAPLYYKAAVVIYNGLKDLPWDLFQAVLGFGLCFFGGSYCASIAAAEAFYMSGWPTTRMHLEEVWKNASLVYEEHEKDEKRDDDGDGIADVKQIATHELMDRKVRLAAKAVKDPYKLSLAIGGLWSGWLVVQGVLRVQFARTISLALSCSQFVEMHACKLLVPFLAAFVGEEFVHWLPVVVGTATKAFFVFWAWQLQMFISAVQSGIRGGLMFSRGLLHWLNEQCGVKELYGFSLEDKNTYLDEIVGFGLAALGVYVQWMHGFGVPFPLNLIMFPMDMIEWYIRWTITSSGGAAQPAV